MGLRSNAVHEMAVEDSATVLIGYAGGVHGVVDVRWNSRVAEGPVPGDWDGGGDSAGSDEWAGAAGGTMGGWRCCRRMTNVHYPLVDNFVEAVLDGAALACPIEEAIWTDWVTGEVMG